eukprot:CAMPEP_0184343580 /NCGR_PEP_ID=MMETSP1089-20130417/12086_1 /TAXON_ID=38269 ORGANISM="Gloeochaete wittrockiana, Strain SAG46.84" /NCGR_SAMPLE_ID=MMETSP1089 /ASSEMBLY_ACC=CAM_ASM_000445 /LENGTH=42 /DNA_ID= /DNA_START= /DNA_END= /DNA_ORIENTATION=
MNRIIVECEAINGNIAEVDDHGRPCVGVGGWDSRCSPSLSGP